MGQKGGGSRPGMGGLKSEGEEREGTEGRECGKGPERDRAGRGMADSDQCLTFTLCPFIGRNSSSISRKSTGN